MLKIWPGTLFTLLYRYNIFGIAVVLLLSSKIFTIFNETPCIWFLLRYCLLIISVWFFLVPNSSGFRDVNLFSYFSGNFKYLLLYYLDIQKAKILAAVYLAPWVIVLWYSGVNINFTAFYNSENIFIWNTLYIIQTFWLTIGVPFKWYIMLL